jgi:hypothetical protein
MKYVKNPDPASGPQSLQLGERGGFGCQRTHGIMECRRSAFGGVEKWNIGYKSQEDG